MRHGLTPALGREFLDDVDRGRRVRDQDSHLLMRRTRASRASAGCDGSVQHPVLGNTPGELPFASFSGSHSRIVTTNGLAVTRRTLALRRRSKVDVGLERIRRTNGRMWCALALTGSSDAHVAAGARR